MRPPILLLHPGPIGTEIRTYFASDGFAVTHVSLAGDAIALFTEDSFPVLMFDIGLIDEGVSLKKFLGELRAAHDGKRTRTIAILDDPKASREWLKNTLRTMEADGAFYPYDPTSLEPGRVVSKWMYAFVKLGPVGEKEAEKRKVSPVIDAVSFADRLLWLEGKQAHPER